MLSQSTIDETVAGALAEDIGPGDITTDATIAGNVVGRAVLLAKAPGVICGLELARAAFRIVEPGVTFASMLADGDRVSGKREIIAQLEGPAAGILTAERVALNFLQRLSGVATLTAAYVEAVAGTRATIIDTRKTTPGLRVLEKYAVRCGGGHNHRFGLSDGVLIKDNHIAASGSIKAAIQRAKSYVPHLMKIEVEVREVGQIGEALAAGADVIMLDNMDLPTMACAVKQIAGHALTEASGGVNLTTVRLIAESGVDLISVGALTHSAPALDISLDLATAS